MPMLFDLYVVLRITSDTINTVLPVRHLLSIIYHITLLDDAAVNGRIGTYFELVCYVGYTVIRMRALKGKPCYAVVRK